MNDEKTDILCMQETEIDINLDVKTLNFPGYELEIENNNQRARVSTFIKSNLSYNHIQPWCLSGLSDTYPMVKKWSVLERPRSESCLRYMYRHSPIFSLITKSLF